MVKKQRKSGQKRRVSVKRKLGVREKILLRSESAGEHFSENFLKRFASLREVRLWVLEWFLMVALVFALALVQISWYGSTHETKSFTRGGSYSEASIGEIASMNPLYATTDSEKILARLLFANLVSPDESGREKAELAHSIVREEDGRTWTLRLRENLKWSDGERIDADDVVFTVGLIKDSAAKTTVSVDFSRVQIEKVDDLTVQFVLPAVYADFMDSLEFPLVPEHILGEVKPALVYEHEFSLKPVSSGTFVVNTLQTGAATDNYKQIAYLNRNERYFKQDSLLDSFNLKVYENEEAVATALKSGNVRATASLERGALELSGDLSLRRSALNAGVFAFLNNRSLPEAALRQAIAQGVDMEKVREGLEDSDVLEYPILESQEANLEYPKVLSYDRELALQRLGELGFVKNGEKLERDGATALLRLAAQDKGQIAKSAKLFAEQLEELGFEVELNLVDESQAGVDFFRDVVQARNYDILFYEIDMGVSADPFVYYSSTQSGESGWNFSGYSNALADDALLSARTTTDKRMRQTKYSAFLRYFVNDVPAIGVYRSSLDYYYAKNTQIFSENLNLTDAYDRFADVNRWAVESKTVNLTP